MQQTETVRRAAEHPENRGGQSFLHGAAILTAGTLLVKILGAIYKIPLTNLIGELGMGYFNTAYQLYLPVYTMATAGFPAAVSRLVAEYTARGDSAGARGIFRKSQPFFWISGLLGMLLMLFGASAYAAFVGSPGAVWSIRALAPTVLLCCVMSGLRGYYAGIRNMTPTALSQILEALGRLVLGLSAAYAVLTRCRQEYSASGTVFGRAVSSEAEALGQALPAASAAAILGVTVGALIALLSLAIYDRRRVPTALRFVSAAQVPVRTRQIAALALPVCAGALMINLAAMLDVTLLQTRLAMIEPLVLQQLFAGLLPDTLAQEERIPFLYGSFTMAQNLAALVPTLAQAIGTSALPSVAAAAACQKAARLREAVESVVRITALVAFPAGFGLCFLANPVLHLLYGARPDGAEIAAPSLLLLGLASVFMTLSVPVNSMLQAVGREDVPVKLLAAGFAVKLLANLVLIPVAQLNLRGACIGTLACYTLVSLCGLAVLRRCCPEQPRFGRCLLRPMLGGLLCGMAADGVWRLLCGRMSPSSATLLAVTAAVLVYVLTVLWGRMLYRSDVESLPGGKKVAESLAKHGWIR